LSTAAQLNREACFGLPFRLRTRCRLPGNRFKTIAIIQIIASSCRANPELPLKENFLFHRIANCILQCSPGKQNVVV
jgi:hypothetical protein